jgi:hypothetical protein
VSQSKARAGRRSVTLHPGKPPHFIVTTFSTPWSSSRGSMAFDVAQQLVTTYLSGPA